MITLYSHDTEKWLLGAIIQDPELQKKASVMPLGWMSLPAHEMILAAIKQLIARKAPVEPLSVCNVLKERGQEDQAGGLSYLLECIRFAPTTANASHYMRDLQRLQKARDAYRMATDMGRQLLEGEDPETAIDALRTNLRNLTSAKGGVTRMGELVVSLFDDVERRSRGEDTALKTCIPDLDKLICGIEPTDMVVIGARPAVGKSAFGMQIALNAARHGKNVLICSREMSRLQYAYRLASNASGINGGRLKRGKLSTGEWTALGDACDIMSRMPISFAFDSATVEELRVQAQHEKDMGRLDLLVVDYLQIMNTSQKSQKRYEAVGQISRALKEIALDLKVPVIAMSQVGRQTIGMGADRAPLMPDLADLRESGNIEQDADIVIFLHHPAGESDRSIPGYDVENRAAIEDMDGHQYIVVKVAKQRQGECGSFGIDFDGGRMTYTCIER